MTAGGRRSRIVRELADAGCVAPDAEAAARCLHPRGSVLLEIGGEQAVEMREVLAALGFADLTVHRDEDGFDRAIEARLEA